MSSYKALSDDQLATLIKGKNIAAFDAVFEKYYRPLCFFASRIVLDNFAAEDLVQDIFVKLWQKQDNTDTTNSIRAYLYVSVRNACFNHLEKNNVKLKHQEYQLKNEDQYEESILQTIIQAEILRQVFDAVDTLPEQCRKIMRMTFEEGKKAKEIAEELGLTVSTVNNQKMRGLNLLKGRLTDEGLAMGLLLFLPAVVDHVK